MNRYVSVLFTVLMVVINGGLLAQDVEQQLQQARQEMEVGNWSAAYGELEAIIMRDSTYAPAHFELSKVLLELDDLRGAGKAINTAISLDQLNEEYRAQANTLAELSAAMNDAKRSLDERDFDGAIARYEQVLEKYPRLAMVHFNLGMAFKLSGQEEQAAEAFRQAHKLAPENENYENALKKLVADKFNEGNRFYNARDWESARERYEEAIRLDSTFERAYYLLARCYQMLRDNQAALEILDKGIAIQPGYVELYVEKGNVLRRESRPDEAEVVFRQAIAINASYDRAWEGLGAVLRTDRPDEAIEAFKTAVDLNPENDGALEYLGEIYSQQDDWEKAQGYLERAVQLKPRDNVTLWRLAHVYNAMEEYQKARDAARRSTNIRPTFEYAWYELGIAEKSLGNRQAAIKAFENALKGRDPSIRRVAEFELNQLTSSNY